MGHRGPFFIPNCNLTGWSSTQLSIVNSCADNVLIALRLILFYPMRCFSDWTCQLTLWQAIPKMFCCFLGVQGSIVLYITKKSFNWVNWNRIWIPCHILPPISEAQLGHCHATACRGVRSLQQLSAQFVSFELSHVRPTISCLPLQRDWHRHVMLCAFQQPDELRQFKIRMRA